MGVMRAEHALVGRCLNVLSEAASAHDRLGDATAQFAVDAAAFLRGFMEERHHGKEEAEMFIRAEELGADVGDISELLADHAHLHGFLYSLETAACDALGAPALLPLIPPIVEDLVGFQRRHIRHEEESIFRRLAEVFDEATDEELLAAFRRVDDDAQYTDAHVEAFVARMDEVEALLAG